MVGAGQIMMSYGATFGFVGLAFTAVDCFAETVRGGPDPLHLIALVLAACLRHGPQIITLCWAHGMHCSFGSYAICHGAEKQATHVLLRLFSHRLLRLRPQMHLHHSRRQVFWMIK